MTLGIWGDIWGPIWGPIWTAYEAPPVDVGGVVHHQMLGDGFPSGREAEYWKRKARENAPKVIKAKRKKSAAGEFRPPDAPASAAATRKDADPPAADTIEGIAGAAFKLTLKARETTLVPGGQGAEKPIKTGTSEPAAPDPAIAELTASVERLISRVDKLLEQHERGRAEKAARRRREQEEEDDEILILS